MSVSDFGAQSWAAVMFMLSSPPSNFYLALCTDEPGTGWDGTVLATVEPAGSATYARQAIAVPAGFGLSDSGYVFNLNEIDFPTPDVSWGVVKYYALTDAATGGNLWAFGALLDPGISALPGADVSVDVASVQIGLANLLPSIVE